MLAEVIAATAPLKATVLLAGVALKFVPVMVTLVPVVPDVGVKLVMVGAVNGSFTIKLLSDVAVCPAVVTVIFPVDADSGTSTISCVAVAEVTVALTPLNFTTFSEAVVLKLVP